MPSFYQSVSWCIMLLSAICSSLVLNLPKLLLSPTWSSGSCPSQTLHPCWGSACLGHGLCSVGSAAGAALGSALWLFCITAPLVAGALFLFQGPLEVSVLHALCSEAQSLCCLCFRGCNGLRCSISTCTDVRF